MGFTLDYFVAEMQCPHCQAISPADNSTNMVTYIRQEPQLDYLNVGDNLIIETEAMPERGYLTIRRPESGEPIKILQLWECPSCGRLNWAEICVDNGTIESITAVPLNQKNLENSHFIHYEAKGVAAALTDQAFAEVADEEVVTILKEHL
jgi:hypothetical protein